MTLIIFLHDSKISEFIGLLNTNIRDKNRLILVLFLIVISVNFHPIMKYQAHFLSVTLVILLLMSIEALPQKERLTSTSLVRKESLQSSGPILITRYRNTYKIKQKAKGATVNQMLATIATTG